MSLVVGLILRVPNQIYSALTSQGVAILPFSDDFYPELLKQASQFTKLHLSFGERAVPIEQAGLEATDQAMLKAEGISSVLMMGIYLLMISKLLLRTAHLL